MKTKPCNMTCVIEGCDKPARGGGCGWCSMHYTRWRRHGDPLVIKRTESKPGAVCRVDGCDRQIKAKSMCMSHYRRYLKYGDPSVVMRMSPKQERKCRIEGCDKLAKLKGMCSMHAARLERNGDPLSLKGRLHWGRSVTADGRTQTIARWSRETGVPSKVIRERLRSGWPVAAALTTPKQTPRLITGPDGRSQTIRQWSQETKLSEELILLRLKLGWPEANAVAYDAAPAIRYAEAEGEVMSLVEWSHVSDINHGTIANRIYRGWPEDDAVTMPPLYPSPHHPPLITGPDGRKQTKAEWAREIGISSTTLGNRLKAGWSIAEAITTARVDQGCYITAFGQTLTLGEWTLKTGISRATIRRRLKDGFAPEEALKVCRYLKRNERRP
jgi:hypothetical protein